jgi:hypothetical protein
VATILFKDLKAGIAAATKESTRKEIFQRLKVKCSIADLLIDIELIMLNAVGRNLSKLGELAV